MDYITRTELEDRMNDVATKIIASTKATLADNKVEILGIIDKKLTDHYCDTVVAVQGRIAEAKIEILGVVKKNIDEAVAPIHQRVDSIDEKVTAIFDGYKSMDQKLDRLIGDTKRRLDEHDKRLDYCDVQFYKLRESGILS